MSLLASPPAAPAHVLSSLREAGLPVLAASEERPTSDWIELTGQDLLVWVSADGAQVGRCALVNLDRAALASGRAGMCLSAGGFTLVAQEWADQRRVALFRLDVTGEPVPVNAPARAVWFDRAA